MAASEGDEMIGGEQSCYRVSVLSGSLEVSARLKNADDLEILMRVLEANKVLFFKGSIELRSCRHETRVGEGRSHDQKGVRKGKTVQTGVCSRGQT